MAITLILLAAGYGTRLYPLTKDKPKALLPLADGVILDAVLKTLPAVPDVRTRVLVTNHRFADQFRDWQKKRGDAVQIVDDGTDTAENRLGAIRDLDLARKDAGAGDDLLVLGTDNVFGWSLADFVAAAKKHHPHPSVALWEASSAEEATQFGVVRRDATARVIEFVEKSKQPPSREVALCVYYFPAPMLGKIQEFLASGENADAPGYFMQWLARRGNVYGIMMPGAWYDIGSLESYNAVLKEWPDVARSQP
jgi:glucose-1-phosphate thymidylyltransferase